MLEELIGIPGAESWTTLEPVQKGWSSDAKYYIEDQAGRKLLLRLSAIGNYGRKQKEYEVVKLFNGLNFTMSRVIDIGVCGQGKFTYMLLTWVEGRPLEECLPALAPEMQYELGVSAGQLLKQLHSIPNVNDLSQWEVRMQAKISSRIDEYVNCPYRLEGDEKAIAYVKQNLGLIHNVEKVYQHGDFHMGNLIYTPEGGIGVIDFNRWDSGDYVEEFYKLQFFDRDRSIPFAKGKLEGYFEGTPPEAFWSRQALYVAYSALFSIQWSIPYGAADIKCMMDRGRMALDDYDYFKRLIPRWYEA